MTIGAPDNGVKDFAVRADQRSSLNFLRAGACVCVCVQCLRECRTRVASALGVADDALGLSMGMSADYAEAIALGSTNVRVGSTIFGARNYDASH